MLCIWRHSTFYQRNAVLSPYMLWSCVCPVVCQSKVGGLSKRRNGSRWFLASRLPSAYPMLFLQENSGISKTGTSLWNFAQTSKLAGFSAMFHNGTSFVASVVNLVRPTTVASLSQSHWASTAVYNTISVTQRVGQVRVRPMRLVKMSLVWGNQNRDRETDRWRD